MVEGKSICMNRQLAAAPHTAEIMLVVNVQGGTHDATGRPEDPSGQVGGEF